MADHTASELRHDLAIEELFALRRRKYVLLSSIVCVVYGVVALGCAFAPELMRRGILPGSSISLGIASMALIMLVAIATSGYYTWWSNRVRDPLLERAKARLEGRS